MDELLPSACALGGLKALEQAGLHIGEWPAAILRPERQGLCRNPSDLIRRRRLSADERQELTDRCGLLRVQVGSVSRLDPLGTCKVMEEG